MKRSFFLALAAIFAFLLPLASQRAMAADPVVTCDIGGDTEQAQRFCTLFESGLPENCNARLIGELSPSPGGGRGVIFRDRTLIVRMNGQVCSLGDTAGWSLMMNELYADFQYANWAGQECGKLYCGGATPASPTQPTQAEIEAATKVCNVTLADGIDARLPEVVCADLDGWFRRVDPSCSYDVQMHFDLGAYGSPYASEMKIEVKGGHVCTPNNMTVNSIMNQFSADFTAVGAIGRQCAELCRLGPAK